MSSPTDPSATPAFLNHDRPPVPDLVVPRGVLPFHLQQRPVRGRLLRLGPLADALLTRHDNHPAVTTLAGQALALQWHDGAVRARVEPGDGKGPPRTGSTGPTPGV